MLQNYFSKQNLIVNGHFIVSMVAILIFLTNISQSGLWYPDAPKHALNGVFYKDLIEEKGFFHPRRYAERYYVQYPSLTISTYPPMFYITEAFWLYRNSKKYSIINLRDYVLI